MFITQLATPSLLVDAAPRDIADEVTTPFRVWSASIYLCALQVRLLDYRVDSAAVALCL